MLKRILLSITIIFLSLSGTELKVEAQNANKFLLPKTFKIQNYPVSQTVSTENKRNSEHKPNSSGIYSGMPVKTNKSGTSTISTDKIQIKTNHTLQTIQTRQNIESNNIQTNSVRVNNTVIQTNPVVKTIKKEKKSEQVDKSVSLKNLVKNYKNSYNDTLKSTVASLNIMGITIISYNTQKGQIIAKLPSGKEIFVLIVPFSAERTCVRITPVDGEYNLPGNTIEEIFSEIEAALYSS